MSGLRIRDDQSKWSFLFLFLFLRFLAGWKGWERTEFFDRMTVGWIEDHVRDGKVVDPA